MTHPMKNRTAIVGLGITEMGRVYRSASDLACEAVFLALKDAGLNKSELDGLLEKVNARVTGPRLEVSQREAFINQVPWTLSVLKKTSAGGFVKESDFLLLAPPQIP